MTITIRNIKVVRETDTDPDLSFIGEYTNTPGPDDRTIDREERRDAGYGEYRYFVAAMSGEQTGNADSVEQDYQRMEDYNRCGWCMVGVYAKAEIAIGTPQGGFSSIQHIRTPGLWGIESDSDDGHITEVAHEELATLRETLAQMNVDMSNFDELAGQALENADD